MIKMMKYMWKQIGAGLLIMTGGWISSPVLAQEHPADSVVLSQDTLPKQTLMIDGKPMTEKAIEMRLAAAVRSYGGVAVKLAATGISGMPDRLILLPGGRMAFVETKAPGKKPRALQEQRMLMLERLGFRCFVIDSVGRIREVLDEIQTA